jgi:hypothetical protein
MRVVSGVVWRGGVVVWYGPTLLHVLMRMITRTQIFEVSVPH